MEPGAGLGQLGHGWNTLHRLLSTRAWSTHSFSQPRATASQPWAHRASGSRCPGRGPGCPGLRDPAARGGDQGAQGSGIPLCPHAHTYSLSNCPDGETEARSHAQSQSGLAESEGLGFSGKATFETKKSFFMFLMN